MRGMSALTLSVCAHALTLNSARAETSSQAPPLTLREVLTPLKERLPKLLEGVYKQRASRGAERSARGLWDPKLKVKGKATPEGPYPSGALSAELRQLTPLWGAELFAGYRLGGGKLPSYKGDLKTLNAGEWSAGLELPLLAGRSLDEGRAKIEERAQWALEADERLSLALLEAERGAAHAYWSWVSASLMLDVQRELLAMAEQRAEGLKERVEHGVSAPITIIDNERLILERSASVIAAERALRVAAYKLSLYHREPSSLRPLLPDDERTPHALIKPWRPTLSSLDEDLERVRQTQPELRAMRRALKALGVKERLAEAMRAPELRVQAFIAQDVGEPQSEDYAKLAPTELGVGVNFELPFGLNKAGGALEEAQAKRLAAQEALRGAEDATNARLLSARVALKTDYEQALLTHRQVKVARALVEAEHVKLNEGASDLITLNLRELSYAKAEASEIKAVIAYHKAWADYLYARGDRLGEATLPSLDSLEGVDVIDNLGVNAQKGTE